jgi:hypothetical protein
VLDGIREWGFHVRKGQFRVVRADIPLGGLTLSPDPPRDVRIVVDREGGYLRTAILFHEFGHAVHSASIRAPSHLLRWHENIPGFAGLTEGIGALFEEIPSDEAWLRRRPGVSEQDIRRHAEGQKDSRAWEIGYLVGWFRSELALYRHPYGDQEADRRRYLKHYFGVDDSPLDSFADPFFVDAAAYSQSYLLATLFAKQIRGAMVDQTNSEFWPNPRAAEWLTTNWFREGSAYAWNERLREVTGRTLSTRKFNEGLR